MNERRSLQELVQDAGIAPILVRQPCLPAPSQPAIVASEEDHLQARNLLVEQRRNNPEYRDPSKQLKRIFRSSKEKERLQDTNQWLFSQDELDQALSAVVNKPTTSPGLIQAFLSLGAKVNFVETADQKKSKGNKPNTSLRRRSTVLQQAATLRRADSVSLLASSGADQTTLDEGLKAALAANDQSCIQELLRHGADINKFPNALADAVRSNDQNLVRLFLRAPKALRAEIISSCLPAAVQHKSEAILSLLIGYGADPNFNGASALKMAISCREYRLAVALVAGPIHLTPVSLQGLLEPMMRMPTAQELYQFLQLLFCCGLSPSSQGLSGLLIAASKRNDTPLAQLLLSYGVSIELNQSECLRIAISQSNWALAEALLAAHVPSAHASVVLAIIPADAPKEDRFRIIQALVQKGATGPPLGRWLVRAVEEGDTPLMDLLLRVGAPLDSGNNKPLQAAVIRKDMRSLQALLKAQPPPSALSQLFPLTYSNCTPSERLEIVRLLLEYGAKGLEVDQALIDAVADISNTRDVTLITELVRYGANVNYNDGQVICLAVTQGDMSILRLLCSFKPTAHSASAALPLAFDSNGNRRRETGEVFELLLHYGLEEDCALQALRIATKGGYENIDLICGLIKANARLLGSAFQEAIALENVPKKAPILDRLLTMGIPQEALDKALAAETHHAITNTDFSILKLLIKHGASVNHNEGESLSVGVTSGNSQLITLLLSGKDSPSQTSTTRAFRALFQSENQQHKRTSQHSRVEIAQELLSRGVEQPAIDSALQASLYSPDKDTSAEAMADLLLRYHANVNTSNGVCFVSAAKRADWIMLDKLLSHGPYFRIVVPALIVSGLDERTLVKAVQLCFECGCTSEDLDAGYHGPHTEPLLVSAMQHYPRSESLIKVLLDHGCNPDTTVRATVESSEGEESVSALIWALIQPQKRISSPVMLALLNAGASPTRSSPVSETAPIAFAAREGRQDIVEALLERGADASARDRWNRSALFYASSTSVTEIVQSLSAHALQNDGSLHEAAKNLQLDVASILIKHGHNPNFPCRLHSGRNALGELCLNSDITNGSQRTKLRQLIRIFLNSGANPKFRARNEKSAVILALENPHNPLEVAEALLETEVWEGLNDEQHMFRDSTGLWYSPLKLIELIPSASRMSQKQQLIELLRDKGCEPKYYSEGADQPKGAIGLPEPIARLVDRQKEHELSIKHAKEVHEHTRNLEETSHQDKLRRKREKQDADLALKTAEQQHHQKLSQQTHDFEMSRVRSAEQMKRSEKVAWHNLIIEQERDTATQRQQVEDRKAGAAYAHEAKLIEQRKSEVEHRAGVERRLLKEKDELFERNANRQKMLTQRIDESAELHARLRQDRPAIEDARWGSVD